MDNNDFTILDVPIQFRTANIGVYNVLVIECPECDYRDTDDNMLWNETVRFGELHGDVVRVSTCPKCGTKFYSHASKSTYGTWENFLELRNLKR